MRAVRSRPCPLYRRTKSDPPCARAPGLSGILTPARKAEASHRGANYRGVGLCVEVWRGEGRYGDKPTLALEEAARKCAAFGVETEMNEPDEEEPALLWVEFPG
jgi:hypothetical protein